jgi:hypothetical protein
LPATEHVARRARAHHSPSRPAGAPTDFDIARRLRPAVEGPRHMQRDECPTWFAGYTHARATVPFCVSAP